MSKVQVFAWEFGVVEGSDSGAKSEKVFTFIDNYGYVLALFAYLPSRIHCLNAWWSLWTDIKS